MRWGPTCGEPVLEYDRRRRLIVCRGRKVVELPCRYLGVDDRAGPNYTGQPTVDSDYEPIEVSRPPH